MRGLDGVVVADHVVGEDDVALLGEIDAARGDGSECRVLQASVVPVAMRGNHRGESSRWGRLGWPVEIAAEIVAGQRFDQDLLYGVGAVLDAPEDLRMERVLRRHGEESGGG